MHPFFRGMDVMKIPYSTNIILDASNPIVLVRAATETECENGIYLVNGETICSCPEKVAQKSGRATTKEEATKGTMAVGEIAGCADGTVTEFPVSTGALTEPERQIIADGCPRYGHSSRPSVSGRTSPPPCRASDRFSKPQSTCSLMQAGCGFCHFLAESNCRAVIGVVYY